MGVAPGQIRAAERSRFGRILALPEEWHAFGGQEGNEVGCTLNQRSRFPCHSTSASLGLSMPYWQMKRLWSWFSMY